MIQMFHMSGFTGLNYTLKIAGLFFGSNMDKHSHWVTFF